MSIKVTVKIDSSALKQIGKAVIKGANVASMALHQDVLSAKVIPFDTGDMQNNNTRPVAAEQVGSRIEAGVATDSVQARNLYFGVPQNKGATKDHFDFQTVNNANARDHWFEPWITGDKKDFIAESFTESIKENLK